MAGRHAKPLQLHIFAGNPSHLTKQEIDERASGEIRFGSRDFVAPRRVRKNRIAFKKWKEIVELYVGGNVDFVTTSDAGVLERYCLTWAEYDRLQAVRDDIEAKGWDKVKTYHAIDELGLETSINKKLDLLLKMEDRLFLNPLAKLRNVPKSPAKEKEQTPLAAAGFGGV